MTTTPAPSVFSATEQPQAKLFAAAETLLTCVFGIGADTPQDAHLSELPKLVDIDTALEAHLRRMHLPVLSFDGPIYADLLMRSQFHLVTVKELVHIVRAHFQAAAAADRELARLRASFGITNGSATMPAVDAVEADPAADLDANITAPIPD